MWSIGYKNINSKLTENDVILMRDMFILKYKKQKELLNLQDEIKNKRKEISTLSLKVIADKFGVSLCTADRIKNRETWRHI